MNSDEKASTPHATRSFARLRPFGCQFGTVAIIHETTAMTVRKLTRVASFRLACPSCVMRSRQEAAGEVLMSNSAPRPRAACATILAAGLAVLGTLVGPIVAHAQGSDWPGRIEIRPVLSQTLPLDAFLRGDKTGPEVLLGGELRLPLGVHGPGPGGDPDPRFRRDRRGAGHVGAHPERGWNCRLHPRQLLRRNIVSTLEDQDQLNSLSMTLDAYRALDMLAAHPRIRPDRIAVWGFSKGAVPAVYSAMDRFRSSFGTQNRFAAHVGFYTPCNVAYDGDEKMAGVPIRLYHGSSDDYVNPAACRSLVARLKPAGVDIALTEYADSQHSFDTPSLPPLVAVPKAQSTRNCQLKEAPGGKLLDTATGQPFTLQTASASRSGLMSVTTPK